MRTLVGEVKGDSYILETYLWLPANVIKSKPRAETRLNTGVGYQESGRSVNRTNYFSAETARRLKMRLGRALIYPPAAVFFGS